MCSEDGKIFMKGDTLGRVISGISTFKEPLRSQRKNCVLCLFGGSSCKKYSCISQGDCAGGQVPEEMGEERQAARQGSPAQLPLVCGLVFIAMDRSGGRRQTDLVHSANRKGVKEPCPF